MRELVNLGANFLLGRSVLLVFCLAVGGAFSFTPGTAAGASSKSETGLPLVTRAQWGSKPKPIPDSRKQVPVWITIHHAGETWHYGDNPVEFVRKMQIWGQERPLKEKPPRNTYWPDLPYHYLIAPDGRIFEGRPVQYEPESNTKYPLKGNIGVEMMGDFNIQRPSVKQVRSCVQLTAWLCNRYHIDLKHVRTHEDAAPGQTDCPGKDFYRYITDGQFRRWVTAAMHKQAPNVVLGPPLPGGPTEGIESTPPAGLPGNPGGLSPAATIRSAPSPAATIRSAPSAAATIRSAPSPAATK